MSTPTTTILQGTLPTPPTDNMGVDNSTNEQKKSFITKGSWNIDYLVLTVWGEGVPDAFDNFFARRGIFRPLKSLNHGGRFYQETWSTDLGVVVRDRPVEEGTFRGTIELPGKACQLLGYPELCNFYRYLLLNFSRVRINRIDTAFNDCNFSVADVLECLLDENLRSYFKRETIKTFSNPYERNDIDQPEDEPTGTSGLTVGGRTSTRYMRIYDKHGYTRLEVEYKAEKARQVGQDLLCAENEETALKLAVGHVMDYVEFFTDWWDVFVTNFSRLYSALPKDVKEMSIEGIKNWFENQVATAFFVLSKLETSEYLKYLAYVGQDKYKKSRYNGLIELAEFERMSA